MIRRLLHLIKMTHCCIHLHWGKIEHTMTFAKLRIKAQLQAMHPTASF